LNLLHSPRVFAFVSRHLLCTVPTAERRLALTFDDGPNPAATPRLLRLLAAARVKATFFLLGRNVLRFPHLAAEIAAAGHEIGNHTHRHLLLPVLPHKLLRHELERAGHLIEAATGAVPRLVRPPMGWFNGTVLRTLAELKYQPVLGDVYPQDTTRPGAREIARRIVTRVRPGSIVIMHDGVPYGQADRSQSVEAARMVIDALQKKSYRFDTVSALLSHSRAEATA
jgi:peptidoglycan/xylan/chitin deacetylase (PgdA/CDA1 family)